MIRQSFIALAIISLFACASSPSVGQTLSSDEANEPIVQTRSSNYFTHDLEATVAFYSELLGLEEAFRSDVAAPKSRESFGIFGDETISVVGFYPPEVDDAAKGFAGIAFFAIEGRTEPLYNLNSENGPVSGVVLAHRVSNVDDIERRMKAAGVTFVSELSLSATGRSRSMTVLDPNGILIEAYEFVSAD